MISSNKLFYILNCVKFTSQNRAVCHYLVSSDHQTLKIKRLCMQRIVLDVQMFQLNEFSELCTVSCIYCTALGISLTSVYILVFETL